MNEETEITAEQESQEPDKEEVTGEPKPRFGLRMVDGSGHAGMRDLGPYDIPAFRWLAQPK